MKAKRNRVSELTNTELKMIRDELLNGESLWSTLKNKWPERPMTILNKLKKRYDCHRSKVVTRGILKDPNLT